MSFTTFADSGTKKLTWIDIGLVKLAVFGFTLLIAKLWTPLLNLKWCWYAIIFVLAGIKPILKFFEK